MFIFIWNERSFLRFIHSINLFFTAIPHLLLFIFQVISFPFSFLMVSACKESYLEQYSDKEILVKLSVWNKISANSFLQLFKLTLHMKRFSLVILFPQETCLKLPICKILPLGCCLGHKYRGNHTYGTCVCICMLFLYFLF